MKVFTHTLRRATPALPLLFLALSACGGGDTSSEETLPPAAQPMVPEVQALVDQGNQAQRAGEYEPALGFYRQAMEISPDHPVPQFGALMAAMALEDEALVDSLSQILQTTAPELLGMLGPEGGMGSGMPADPHAGGVAEMPSSPDMPGQVEDLPPGHPTLYTVTPDTVGPDTATVAGH